MKGTIKLKKRGNKNLRIAMIGHKVVPSRRGGIERVLTIIDDYVSINDKKRPPSNML